MNGFDWIKKETYTCTGINQLQNQINICCQNYKTNLVASKIRADFAQPTDKYDVEVWYNFDSRCYVVNVHELYE